jgi:sugar lactone lactonase YvrE
VDTEVGSAELVAPAPAGTVINGIDVDGGFLYGADTFGGLVWRAPKAGGDLEIWSDDPLLDLPPGSPFPGPNGLRVFRREVLVVNSSTGDIVGIPIQPNRTAGAAYVRATLPPPQGGDEFAIDVHGSIYCTTDPFNTLVRLDSDGTTEILLTAADLLDGPTSAAFGRRGRNRKNLYITNGAFPIFGGVRPSLMRLRLGTPGAP